MNPHLEDLLVYGIARNYEYVLSLFDRDTPLADVSPEYLRGVLDLAGRLWATQTCPPEAIKDAFRAALSADLPESK
jgi:hypothetical protein